jgi:hypothetical protein
LFNHLDKCANAIRTTGVNSITLFTP